MRISTRGQNAAKLILIMGKLNENKVEQSVQKILHDYEDDKYVNNTNLYNQPDKKQSLNLLRNFLKLSIPDIILIKSIKSTV